MQRHKQEGNGPTGVLLTREEVGERLAISPRTVARLVARGELPVVRIGRLARYRGTDVTAVIEACLETERSLERAVATRNDERLAGQRGVVTTSAGQGRGSTG